MASLYNFSRTSYDDPGGPPPGSPPTLKYEGPWLSTQIMISTSIGMTSLFIFSYCRTRWPLLFAPRTKLKGFSPHEAHAHGAFFGWILPTLRVSEYSVLQIVGLDAAVLLNFFKMSFYLFSLCSAFAITILMPVNLKNNIGIGDEDDEDTDWPTLHLPDKSPNKRPDWFDLVSDANSYLSLHLVFTYLFTLLSLRMIFLNYKRFIKARQLFSLQLVHSIAARTVMVTGLPHHLRSERVLAEHFENMKLSVESVSICREISSLEHLIEARTRALLKLEDAWVQYVGNPSTAETYDPSDHAIIGDGDLTSTEAQVPNRFVVPHHRRPTIRPRWFSGRVDAIEYLEKRFLEADEAVKRHRRTGRFKPMDVGFVTFEKMSSAQIAAQTVHTSAPFQLETCLAPEPRDIVWANVGLSPSALRFRDAIALGILTLLFFFWGIPITGLASLLSYKEIKKVMPWLGLLIDSNEKIRAIVQNSLPSVALITLNALLPFLLEAITYVQGFRARSLIEYSLMKKYFLFLLVNVVFIFLLASTYWQLVRDLANSPAKIPEKLAQALQMGRAKHFFLSYVILQGLGIMPLQLLNLGIIIPQFFFRLLITRTPRDFAELNAPPVINYGAVYPQAILIFVITLLYSIAQPLILIFGAVYFGVAYLVYKYKLLFVFYKPYESQGQAWPITFTRLIWGVVIFLVFMSGNFVLKGSFVLSFLVAPLVIFTVAWSVYISKSFRGPSKYVNLSAVFEVQRGEETEDVSRLREGHPVTWSQSNLNRRRYAQNDDVLYVAPEDDRTDYSQPPMANWYNGVLNTGKRRYGHPALTGLLPQPWLPLKRGETLVNSQNTDRNGRKSGQAVVLSLRKRYSVVRRGGRTSTTRISTTSRGAPIQDSVRGSITSSGELGGDVTNNPWQESAPDSSNGSQSHHTISHRLSYDFGSGVIVLPDDQIWLDGMESDSEDDDGNGNIEGGQATPERAVSEDDHGSGGSDGQTITGLSRTRYGTYFHHPERRWQSVPGAFPTSS